MIVKKTARELCERDIVVGKGVIQKIIPGDTDFAKIHFIVDFGMSNFHLRPMDVVYVKEEKNLTLVED